MTTAVDDFAAIRARQAEIAAAGRGQPETAPPAPGRMPEDDWATLRAQCRDVRVDGDRPRVVPARVLP